MGPSILLVDNHRLFREGVACLLQQLDDRADVVGVDGLHDACDLLAGQARFDLVLMNIDESYKPQLNRVESFVRQYPGIPLVVLSASESRQHIVSAMRMGAHGYIPKSACGKSTITSLKIVLNGGFFLPPQLLNGQEEQGIRPHQSEQEQSVLTHRQYEILCLLADGLSAKEIATKLSLAEGTIKTHIATAYRALGVTKRIEAVNVAKRMGILK